MGMTIDEIIAKEKEIADEFQNTVDTHMVNSGRSLEEMYCDDTEVIEENLKRCKELSNYHNTIANTMHKYQKIQEIYLKWIRNYDITTSSAWTEVIEVLEDGEMTNKEFIDKLTKNIPTWKLVLIDKWTDFKVWFWLKTHKGVNNGNDV